MLTTSTILDVKEFQVLEEEKKLETYGKYRELKMRKSSVKMLNKKMNNTRGLRFRSKRLRGDLKLTYCAKRVMSTCNALLLRVIDAHLITAF